MVVFPPSSLRATASSLSLSLWQKCSPTFEEWLRTIWNGELWAFRASVDELWTFLTGVLSGIQAEQQRVDSCPQSPVSSCVRHCTLLISSNILFSFQMCECCQCNCECSIESPSMRVENSLIQCKMRSLPELMSPTALLMPAAQMRGIHYVLLHWAELSSILVKVL